MDKPGALSIPQIIKEPHLLDVYLETEREVQTSISNFYCLSLLDAILGAVV